MSAVGGAGSGVESGAGAAGSQSRSCAGRAAARPGAAPPPSPRRAAAAASSGCCAVGSAWTEACSGKPPSQRHRCTLPAAPSHAQRAPSPRPHSRPPRGAAGRGGASGGCEGGKDARLALTPQRQFHLGGQRAARTPRHRWRTPEGSRGGDDADAVVSNPWLHPTFETFGRQTPCGTRQHRRAATRTGTGTLRLRKRRNLLRNL